MISKKMEAALNEQINKELYSAYLYLAMSAAAAEQGLMGVANWFRVQFHEEQVHALKIFDYVVEQGGCIELAAIKQPETEFKSPVKMFEAGLKHEKFVTASINGLVDLANKHNDHATAGFLQWFVKEQIEEEANAVDILNKIKLGGESGAALLFLDGKLSERKFEAD